MTKIIEQIAMNELTEAKDSIYEAIQNIAVRKLEEMKKIAAAKLTEASDHLKFKVTHHDGSTTMHKIPLSANSYPYPEFISREIKSQLKAQGKPTNYKSSENVSGTKVYRDRGRTAWVKDKKKD
jgi:hypothetical protein